MEKQKKKKKHRFLKFLLFNAMLVLLYFGIVWVCNRLAYKELDRVMVAYPFQYTNETNAVWYVTDDFSVPTSYTDEEKKEYHVKWTSSNENIILFGEDGNASVNRPSDVSQIVTVTQTYKKFLGKAEIQYELNVAALSTLTEDEVKVVTLEELIQQTYNRDMRAVLDENNNLDYMIGDFKDTRVYSTEDALVILNAYRGQFQTPETYSFVFDKVVDTTDLINYIFSVYYEGYKVEGASANITVFKETGDVRKIDISIGDAIEGLEAAGTDLDYEAIIKDYITNCDTEKKDYEMVIIEKGEMILDGRLSKIYHILFENGAYFTMYIDAGSGEVLKYGTSEHTLFERTSVTSQGKTELGEEVTLNTSKNSFGTVVMHDMERDIHVYDNNGWFGLYKSAESKEEPGIFEMLGGLIDYGISNNLNAEIKAKDGYIDDCVAVQSQYYIQLAYDWYEDTFGLISYDGKGAPIVIITDIQTQYDNASWMGNEKTFRVNPAKRLLYSVSSGAEVMAHEYTHAVFGSKLSGSFDNATDELAGINEAYADLFGCLASDSKDWLIGRNKMADTEKDVCFRDLANINREEASLSNIGICGDVVYPETYKGENWTGECHNISVLISHVAYEMWASDLFTEQEVADIWYNSLAYGYTAASTFLTTREYVLAAAEDKNCTEEQIVFIENAFADVGIGDYAENVIETESDAVEGDILLDDTQSHTYLIVYSALGTIFGDAGIYIFQDDTGASKAEIAEASRRLTEMVNQKYGGITLSGKDITVEYKQVNQKAMDILCDFCEGSETYLRDLSYEALEKSVGESVGTNAFLEFMLKLGFTWEVREGTAYDIYDSLGLIE